MSFLEPYLGAHMSLAKGIDGAIRAAHSIGATTMQIFTRNPRGGARKIFSSEDYASFLALLEEYHMGPILCHAPYTVNLATDEASKASFAEMAIQEDLAHAAALKAVGLVVHAGSHRTSTYQEGFDRLLKRIHGLLDYATPNTPLLIETMSGSGSELGRTLEDFHHMLQRFNDDPRLRVCLDTCHLFAAGYDLSDTKHFVRTIDEAIGWGRVAAVHLNDSKTPFASHKDRHAPLGEGQIGMESFTAFIKEPCLQGKTVVLETPNDLDGWAKEILLLREALTQSTA